MRTIRPCPACSAPVSLKMSRCPNCNRRNPLGMLARTASMFAAAVGGLTISSTLAACYGAPCADGDDSCPDNNYVPTCAELSLQPAVDDKDGDGYCLAKDCNENDKTINSAARDVPGDGIDQNCDGRDTPK